MITDYDCWKVEEEPVSAQAVFESPGRERGNRKEDSDQRHTQDPVGAELARAYRARFGVGYRSKAMAGGNDRTPSTDPQPVPLEENSLRRAGKGFAQRTNLRFFMHGRHGDSQSGRAFRHRRVAECRDKKSFALQGSRQIDRCLFVTDYPGCDGAMASHYALKRRRWRRQ